MASNANVAPAAQQQQSGALPTPFLEENENDAVKYNKPVGAADASKAAPAPFLEELPTDKEKFNRPVNASSQQTATRPGKVPGVTSPKSSASWGSMASCLSNLSTGSSQFFAEKNQTIILFDWDDSLCPSTWCMRTLQLRVHLEAPEEYRPQLQEIGDASQKVLELAEQLGHVVIVTNAEAGWVEVSCKAWMKSLWPIVQRFDVISARSTFEPKGVSSPVGWKAHAFQDVIQQFYSRYAKQSWKNVISIGDAPYERDALIRVTEQSKHTKCRVKAVKLAVRPNNTKLVNELKMLHESLVTIVSHDANLDLEYDESLLG